jgi:nitroreductase
MNTNIPILKELNQRRSIRAYLPKAIESEKLDALWAAAQWAPSCSNKQDWHYYAVTGNARQKLANVLSQGNAWALKAPLILCVTHDTATEAIVQSRQYGMYNVALSVMCLVVEAEHQGLRARQMAGFDETAFRIALDLPINEAPAVIVAVGYEDPSMKELDSALQGREKVRPPRKEIGEIITIVK